MRKKILIITPFYPPSVGGAETYSKALVDEACKKYGGANIYLATCNPDKFKVPFKGIGIKQFLLVFPELYTRSAKIIRHNNINTIHTQGLQATLVGAILKWKYKVRLCATTLALYNFKKGSDKGNVLSRVVAFILNRCDRIFVEGNAGEKDLTDIGVIPAKIRHFEHWVTFPAAQFAKTFHPRLRVLFIGRAIEEKNKVMIQEIQKDPEMRCATFSYVEYVEHELLPNFYRWADILVVPSNYAEGFVRVIVEAAWYGCAIITSNQGGLPEMVREYGTSLPLKKEIWHEVIYILSENRDILKQKQLKAFEYAHKYYTPDNARKMIDEY